MGKSEPGDKTLFDEMNEMVNRCCKRMNAAAVAAASAQLLLLFFLFVFVLNYFILYV